MTKIEKRIAELRKEEKMLEVLELAIGRVENEMKWHCMDAKHEDDGTAVYDENGDIVYEAPAENDYRYDEYVAFRSIIEHMMKLVK